MVQCFSRSALLRIVVTQFLVAKVARIDLRGFYMLAGCVPGIFLMFTISNTDKIIHFQDCGGFDFRRFTVVSTITERETALVIDTFFPCGNHWLS